MRAFDILTARGVTRLCHFTKLLSLAQIVTSDAGILASDSIRPDTKNATDTSRIDGALDFVCCSVEYPNSWFLSDAIRRDTNKIFNEWVVLYVNLQILNHRDLKFCPGNASKAGGAYIDNNMENVGSIFATTVPTWNYPRSPQMLSSCPTNGQAEILIKNSIPRSYITGIAVGNYEMARRVYAMLKTSNMENIPIYVAPEVLDIDWSRMVRNGQKPNETKFAWSEEE